MACLDSYKSPDQKGHYPPMSPRLSFSNDFVESHHPTNTNTNTHISQHQNSPPNISASDDFEFSALTNPSNHTMTAADELFFKGKLLPTLRDELLLHDDDDDAIVVPSFVPPKGLPKWKEFLSLKRSVVDGRCTGTGTDNDNNQGKMPKLALHDKSSHLDMTS
ncbi:uncharacterized protein LOC111804229 [Cucurbita pepo subsp. pepo]|uniref:uncharacterized protein LOC111804229 n=1 Tax=Cucurbita pepo subsp. pepo TaxID=3664 RepID=UPI000C9D9359|nr:uncharacterized protein LOC111804229 [Cucurbita pepo subsp. pepo]